MSEYIEDYKVPTKDMVETRERILFNLWAKQNDIGSWEYNDWIYKIPKGAIKIPQFRSLEPLKYYNIEIVNNDKNLYRESILNISLIIFLNSGMRHFTDLTPEKDTEWLILDKNNVELFKSISTYKKYSRYIHEPAFCTYTEQIKNNFELKKLCCDIQDPNIGNEKP